jgi:hypothetical protein
MESQSVYYSLLNAILEGISDASLIEHSMDDLM